VIRTFIEFTLRATRNRIVSRLKRLRDPRYLVGAVAGLAYLWFAFFRNTRGMPAKRAMAATGDLLVDGLGLVILVMMILAWALPSDRGGLQFSEAEIATLFPAPLRRRDLLLYKIIRMQPQALISSLFFFILGWRQSFVIGVWAAISVLGIYFMLVNLGRARLKQMHVGFIARLLIAMTIVGALGWFGLSKVERLPSRFNRRDPSAAVRAVDKAFRESGVSAVLFVPRLFATAALAPTPARMAASVGGLFILGGLFFVLAARLNISFEEASIAASARRAARLEKLRARQGGKMQVSYRRLGPLFKLGETGPAEIAIVWKNVIALMRTGFGIVVMMLVLSAGMIGIALWAREESSYMVIGTLFLFMAGFFPLTGSQLFANDLRLDLARSEILKSYPLTGHRLVAAEIAAPLAVITALDVLFCVCGSIFMRLAGTNEKELQFFGTPQFIISMLILVLPVCAILLLIRNAMPLYFPAWSMRPADEPRSFVTVGQKIVVLFANLFALLIALIPAGIVFAPSLWIAVKFFRGSPIFMAVAAVPAAMVIVAEVWLGVRMLGARFDAMDVSNEFELVEV
jgi:ABC-2 type transport system permease protein